jgi:putative FmdB family regulatory protein
MPTYDYECDGCGHRLELFQRISDDPIKQCPACGKNKLRRLFGTGAAIVFKGSGFYQTDYRSESYKSAAAKENKESGGSDKSGGGDKSKSSDGSTSPSPAPAKDPDKKKSTE